MTFIERVTAMGDRVAARLGTRKHDLEPIGDYFNEELKSFSYAGEFELGKFARELIHFKLPVQLDRRGDFGQPAITLYVDSLGRFVIEIYIWQNIDTAIHDHGFSGAGQVIYGRSLESFYHYEEHQAVSEYVGIGKLRTIHSRILERGDLFRVPATNKYIHQVHHLVKPTMSLIGRTTYPLGIEQRMYYQPGLRIDRRAVDELGSDFTKKTEFLSLLREQRDPTEEEFLLGLMKKSTDATLWVHFLQFLRNGPSWSEVENTVGTLKEFFGPWAQIFEGLARYYLPDFQLTMTIAKDPEEELFLILMSLWGFGEKMESLLAEAFPGKSGKMIVNDNLRRLINKKGFNPKWVRSFVDAYENPGKYTSRQLAKRYALTEWDLQMISKFKIDSLLRIDRQGPVVVPHLTPSLSSNLSV